MDCFSNMKKLVFILFLFICQVSSAQKNIPVIFLNDYPDVYHLSLIIYTPDGKNQTRVGNLQPGEQKKYVLLVGTEIFIVDRKQEAFAMNGNDIKESGAKPSIVLKDSSISIKLSSLTQANGVQPAKKE